MELTKSEPDASPGHCQLPGGQRGLQDNSQASECPRAHVAPENTWNSIVVHRLYFRIVVQQPDKDEEELEVVIDPR